MLKYVKRKGEIVEGVYSRIRYSWMTWLSVYIITVKYIQYIFLKIKHRFLGAHRNVYFRKKYQI